MHFIIPWWGSQSITSPLLRGMDAVSVVKRRVEMHIKTRSEERWIPLTAGQVDVATLMMVDESWTARNQALYVVRRLVWRRHERWPSKVMRSGRLDGLLCWIGSRHVRWANGLVPQVRERGV
jgi:hypothetical protein